MSEYLKCFDGSEKDMSFKVENDNTLIKYNKIWTKLKRH